MFVYLNKTYVMNNDIVGIEIVLSNTLDETEYETIHKDNFNSINNKYRDCVKDFSVVDNSIICNHEVRRIDIPSVSFLPKEETIRDVEVTSLYDLLKDLAINSCGYSYSDEKLVDGYIGFIPTFKKIKVSKSTMSIYISVLNDDNDRWSTKRLVMMCDDGMLRQSPFYCLIEKNKTDSFKKYRLDFIKDCCINNIDYSVFKYDCGLPICSITKSYSFCEPLIVHYSYISYLFSNLITSVKAIQSKYIQYEKVSDSKNQSEIDRVPTSKSGIFFDIAEPNISRADAMAIVNICEMVCSECKGRDIPKDYVSNYISSTKLPNIYRYCMSDILKIIKSGERIRLDIVDNSQSLLDTYSYHGLISDLYLYNIRVGCIFNKDILRHRKMYSSFQIQGSKYNTTVKVIKRGVDRSV